MAHFPGEVGGGPGGPVAHTTRIAAHHDYVRRTLAPSDDLAAITTTGNRMGVNLAAVSHVPTPPAAVHHAGCRDDRAGGFAFDWFEKFHIQPTSYVLGNVLATQQIATVLYSAYRRAVHSWDSFVNNAGAGINLLNQPALPYDFDPQTGLTNLVVEVAPNGPPVVDSTLDFVFDTMTLSPIIQLNRLVLFDLPPELPYRELLEFLTDVQLHRGGTEHRLALRKNPRQFFDWSVVLEDSRTRSRIHNLLFDWKGRVFGVPIWHEATKLSASASSTDLTINVLTTSFADYREEGLVLVYESSAKFDVLEIDAGGIGGTALTFTNGLQNDYDAGTLVMPLRSGILRATTAGQRLITDAGLLELAFQVLDNDSDLASTSGWDTYDSKVILNDVNSVGGSGNSISEEIIQDIIVIDNQVGVATIESLWDRSKRRHPKTFWCRTPEEIWKVRRLLHALRGRQVAFYSPTKGQDLVPTSDLMSGSSSLTVQNVGYARYVQNRQSRNVIQVIFNDGTPTLVREITASAEVDADTETLTLDTTWPATYTPSQVERVEYLELSRLDSDRIRFNYAPGDKTCRISAPITTVFDE